MIETNDSQTFVAKLMRFIIGASAIYIICAQVSQTAYAFYLNGSGHYSLQGKTQTSPVFASDRGTIQVVDQNLRLLGEARFSDKFSLYLEFRLFDNPRQAYLGDSPEPGICAARSNQPAGSDPDCSGRFQSTGEPGYAAYIPKISQAYVRYAFDYCLLEAGRRGRDWGMGLLLDSGKDMFDTDASVFDGLTCNFNLQKTQTLGFSIGYDKLQETGTYEDNPYENPIAEAAEKTSFDQRSTTFGATNKSDDLDQYFFTIEYDDRKANAGTGFTKHIAIYFANVVGAASTDLKYFDLYTGFQMADLALQNEILFRLGKSGDPYWREFGGAREDDEGSTVNRLQSIGLAGRVGWTFARSGSSLGPREFRQGDAARHVGFFEYAYAPGDKDGYFNSSTRINEAGLAKAGESNRDADVTAIAFHRNFKPALLMFNGKPVTDDARVGGVFDPDRVMNATLFGVGYQFESFHLGIFEAKLIKGSLNTSVPAAVKEFYDNVDQYVAAGDEMRTRRPVGFYGRDLGFELDLKYDYPIDQNVKLGGAFALGFPGNAWKTKESGGPSNGYLIQAHLGFEF